MAVEEESKAERSQKQHQQRHPQRERDGSGTVTGVTTTARVPSPQAPAPMDVPVVHRDVPSHIAPTPSPELHTAVLKRRLTFGSESADTKPSTATITAQKQPRAGDAENALPPQPERSDPYASLLGDVPSTTATDPAKAATARAPTPASPVLVMGTMGGKPPTSGARRPPTSEGMTLNRRLTFGDADTPASGSTALASAVAGLAAMPTPQSAPRDGPNASFDEDVTLVTKSAFRELDGLFASPGWSMPVPRASGPRHPPQLPMAPPAAPQEPSPSADFQVFMD